MMQKLQNRPTAILITVCVVVLSILLGASTSLNRLRSEAEGVFYYGVGGNGHGIYADLNQIADNSTNLATVAKRYLDANDVRLDAIERGVEELHLSFSPAAKHTAAEELRVAVNHLDAYLRTLALSDSDKTYQDKLMANIDAGYRVIGQSGYNDAATQFNQTLRAFPAGILGDITGVKSLELYE